MKLYQALLEKLKLQPATDPAGQVFNPAGAKIGSTVDISFLDYRGKDFKVSDIQEYSTTIDGENIPAGRLRAGAISRRMAKATKP